MATVVVYKETGEEYILLGTGFGSYQSKKANWFFGDLIAEVDEGTNPMVCVCDKNGKVGWLESHKVTVVSIDGRKVNELL
ncbi:MAG: hypothetical protein ACMUIG_07915 [Thermoplasmatota archaeon]